MDVLDAMIRDGFSLARSVALVAQWDEILGAGLVSPVTVDDLRLARSGGLGEFRRVAGDLHCGLSNFIHGAVVHRRDEAIRRWRKWLRPDLVPPAPFPPVPHLTHGGCWVLAGPAWIDKEFRKAWLLHFCRSGESEASHKEFALEVDGWLPLLPVAALPELTGEVLAEVVRRKGATAGSLDGWGWKELELKVLPVPWFDGLARILSKVEETGVLMPILL